MIKEDSHIFQGMRRDNHQIKQDGKYLWDAHNIRLTNREDNTLLSITNERGTSDPLLTLDGLYVGHCTIGKYLVLFTAMKNRTNNTIYRIQRDSNGKYKYIILFNSPDEQESSWSPDYPLETLGIYETKFVQKVYWVDGKNQPRVINIAKPELILSETVSADGATYEILHNGVNLSGTASSERGGYCYSETEAVDMYLDDKLSGKGLYSLDSFDFVRSLELKETVVVERETGGGLFAPGIIQYAISYYNKYEQETNIVQVTPIQYISYNDRGASAEDTVANIFKVTVNGIDTNFEYIRLYSIHRTSIDTTPQVRVVANIPLSGNSENYITFTDNGTIGYTITPDQLLYVGGKSIIATTMACKDNTLFLGNITLQQYKNFEDIVKKYDTGGDAYEIIPDAYFEKYDNEKYKTDTYYSYDNSLSKGYSARFQSGEYYRCGVQVQVKDGTWSDPIFLADEILCTSPPFDGSSMARIELYNVKKMREAGIKRVRSCIVFPKSYERTVLCEGVLCPTVYSAADRNNNSPYASSSWFFRPAISSAYDNTTQEPYRGASIQYQHNKPLFTGKSRGAEIQNMISSSDITDVNSINSSNFEKYKNYYFVDENIVTFHSPDIEFDTDLQHADWSNVKLDIIGMAQLDAVSGDIDITASSSGVDIDTYHPKGFLHNKVGFPTNYGPTTNAGLTAGLFYDSNIISSEYKELAGTAFMVYPWHRSGSLNNDAARPDDKGARTAILKTKVISNLKFFSRNVALPSKITSEDSTEDSTNPNPYKITTPQLFNQDVLSVVKIAPDYFNAEVPYMGNIDTLSTSPEEYPFYTGGYFEGAISELTNSYRPTEAIVSTSDPVRIKYKSSPHLVFSLKGETNKQIKLLPRMKDFGTRLNGVYTFPTWQQTTPSDGIRGEIAFYDCLKLYYSYRPSKSEVGKYIYEKYSYGDVNFFTLVEVISTTGGTGYRAVTDDELIIKFASGRSITSFSNSTPPNTEFIKNDTKNEDDYDLISGDNYRYIGQDRYYKFTKKGSAIGPTLFGLYVFSKLYQYEVTDVTTEAATGDPNTTYTLRQDQFSGDSTTETYPPYLLVARLIKEGSEETRFGGTSDKAIQQNLWLPAGEPVSIPDPVITITKDDQGNATETETEADSVTVPIQYGDTWYSRYDCLKTYPYTTEDENQIVEIGSFMCETRVNIDGRYDRNRGLLSNNSILPTNFNQLNSVYNQKDNFFNYTIIDKDFYKQDTFINQVTWSKERQLGEDIDTWTNVTMANILNMNGDKDKITAIRVQNDQLFCFQEKAVSKINFNSRVEIPVSDGVPIEITNGRKVDGSTLINDQIGCSNKWSIITTSAGLYFIDSNTSAIYSITDKLNNLSSAEGMSWWVRDSHPETEWIPYTTGPYYGIRSFYDAKYGDVYFSPSYGSADNRDALCYSQALGKFTSLMSYGGVQAMFNFNNGFYSLVSQDDKTISLYQNNVGKYNNFYGVYKGWSFSFISNPESHLVKVFDNINIRADRYIDHLYPEGQPFQWIRAENEYQDTGKVSFGKRDLMKKFRVWRGTIPRSLDTVTKQRTMQRIRNTWSQITLGIDNNNDTPDESKVVVHDVIVRYTI